MIDVQIDTFLAVLAQTPKQGSEIPWFQVITGVLAIPTALIGLVYAYRLTQKTRLESRKLQLDILEAEGKRVASTEAGTVLPRSDIAGSPRAVAVSTQDIVFRFVVLFIAGQAWSLIERALQPLVTAALSIFFNEQEVAVSIQVVTFSLVSLITGVGYLVIFLIASVGLRYLLDIIRCRATSQGRLCEADFVSARARRGVSEG